MGFIDQQMRNDLHTIAYCYSNPKTKVRAEACIRDLTKTERKVLLNHLNRSLSTLLTAEDIRIQRSVASKLKYIYGDTPLGATKKRNFKTKTSRSLQNLFHLRKSSSQVLDKIISWENSTILKLESQHQQLIDEFNKNGHTLEMFDPANEEGLKHQSPTWKKLYEDEELFKCKHAYHILHLENDAPLEVIETALTRLLEDNPLFPELNSTKEQKNACFALYLLKKAEATLFPDPKEPKNLETAFKTWNMLKQKNSNPKLDDQILCLVQILLQELDHNTLLQLNIRKELYIQKRFGNHPVDFLEEFDPANLEGFIAENPHVYSEERFKNDTLDQTLKLKYHSTEFAINRAFANFLKTHPLTDELWDDCIKLFLLKSAEATFFPHKKTPHTLGEAFKQWHLLKNEPDADQKDLEEKLIGLCALLVEPSSSSS